MSLRFSLIAGIMAALLTLPNSHAEVSVVPRGSTVSTLVLAITEDSDPFGVWLQYRPVSASQVLNPEGHARGDGRPDIAWRNNTWPLAVWAYNAGSDSDITFSEWDGTQWTTTEFLTATTGDERDPRLFVEPDGTVHVVWWTSGPSEEVYLTTRENGSSTWGPPVQVTSETETGRRPSVAVFDGELSVAYERDSVTPGMIQDVVVAVLQSGGGFVFEVIGTTVRTAELDVVLHAEQAHLWTDWKHEVGEFGCAEYHAGAGWSGNPPEPWTDPSWIGVEETRKAIRGQVLN